MTSHLSITVILITAMVLWGVMLLLLGYELSWYHLKPFSFTLFMLTTLLTLYNKYLWKCFPLSYFCRVPNLNGTWKVTLRSTYKNPETGERVAAITGFAVVCQTFSTLSIRLMTEKYESRLLAHRFIEGDFDGQQEVFGVFQSDPRIHLRGENSVIHYGSFIYKVSGKSPQEMSGTYWTDRNTVGSIELYSRHTKIVSSYSEALDEFKISNSANK